MTNPNLTAAGRSLLIRASGGEALTFTRFAVGSGQLKAGQDADALDKLIKEEVSFEIRAMNISGNYMQMDGDFDTGMVSTDFTWRELGLFCKGEDGAEHLYAYLNYGETGGVIRAQTSTTVTMQTVSLMVLVGNAASVTALLAPSKTYAPMLHEHSLNQIAASGSYTGDGTVKRMISLSFTPSAVFLCTDKGVINTNGISGGLALKGHGLRATGSTDAGHAVTWNDTYTALMITEGGFFVNYQAGSIATNESGANYHYIAYR